MKHYQKYIVEGEQAGLNVESYLKNYAGYSGRRLQKLTRAKGILLNGKNAFLQRSLKAGDQLKVLVLEDQSYGVEPEEGPIDILYEDNDLIILNKPAGQLVHPAGHTTGGTLANHLAFYLKNKGELSIIRPLHRLDLDTSGCIAFAKNAHTQTVLEKQLQNGTMKRSYVALVKGNLETEEGLIDAPIGVDRHRANRRMVCPDGEEARTYYQVEKAFSGFSLLALNLETGRTHQIRVHLAYLGYPVVGDRMYGSYSPLIGRQALHAFKLELNYPHEDKKLNITAPLPEDILTLIDKLGHIQ